METKIIQAYLIHDPCKTFLICDINEGRDFVDPLILMNHPEYDPFSVNELGCYAEGGMTDPSTLLKSYKWGIFPWFAYRSMEKYWYCPSERFVIFPEKVHIGHSLRNLMNKTDYRLTVNKAFSQVINHCRTVNKRHNEENAWLGEEIMENFLEFNKMGYAKSVELWEDEELIGGFYGVWINGVFQGDSMFSLRPSASQIALVKLCQLGEIEGERLKFIDTQYSTPTFQRLGGEYISYEEYRRELDSNSDIDQQGD